MEEGSVTDPDSITVTLHHEDARWLWEELIDAEKHAQGQEMLHPGSLHATGRLMRIMSLKGEIEDKLGMDNYTLGKPMAPGDRPAA
jgi:hypothetical protein